MPIIKMPISKMPIIKATMTKTTAPPGEKDDEDGENNAADKT